MAAPFTCKKPVIAIKVEGELCESISTLVANQALRHLKKRSCREFCDEIVQVLIGVGSKQILVMYHDGETVRGEVKFPRPAPLKNTASP